MCRLVPSGVAAALAVLPAPECTQQHAFHLQVERALDELNEKVDDLVLRPQVCMNLHLAMFDHPLGSSVQVGRPARLLVSSRRDEWFR